MSDQKGSFFTKSTDSNIQKAEDELNAALEIERPEELGARIKDNTKEKTPDNTADLPDADGHNWKERYANLQRFVQKKLGDAKKDKESVEAKLTDLQTKFESFSKKAAPAELPETEEEVDELRKNNPAAYNAIVKIAKTLAQEIVEEKTKGLQASFRNVEQEQVRVAEADAFLSLKKLHPDLDLDTLDSNPEFQEWIESQPEQVQDLLYKNKTDFRAASTVLKMFKLETGHGQKKSTKKDPKKLGAEDVNTRSGVDLPSGDKGYDFIESEIERMSNKSGKWFEQNMEAIDKAARSGRILLDLSDPIGSAKRQAA